MVSAFADYLIPSLNPTALCAQAAAHAQNIPRSGELANLIISIRDPRDCRAYFPTYEICLRQQRGACSFPTPFPGLISEIPDAPRTGPATPVGSYTRAIVPPACHRKSST